MSDEKDQRPDKKPKIIVDEDWKAQAEAEKQKLAEKEQQPAAAPSGAAPTRELPPASFADLVSSILTQALFALGAIEDPQTKKRYRNMTLAKHHIDLLGLLEEKTRGNLTAEEKSVLDQALYEVRLRYVQMAQSS